MIAPLRAAGPQDAAPIARIMRTARKTAMPWLPDLHTEAQDLWFVTHRMLPLDSVAVAEASGVVQGFIATHDDWLNHLYLAPPVWRCGIGSALLTHARDGRTFLQLWVFQRNTAAQAFYHKHGFTVAERTDGSGNEEGFPDVRMAWRA